MKRIYLVGFRGTGFRDVNFSAEPALIWAGHVGIMFEDDPGLILGFHPTEEAVKAAGGTQEAVQRLRAKGTLAGILQQDYLIFVRAAQLAQQGARTAVWQLVTQVEDDVYEQIRQQALTWYNEKIQFSYAFPTDELMPDRDNCATFPRRLGLPVLDPVGQIKDYVSQLEQQGEPWQPREE